MSLSQAKKKEYLNLPNYLTLTRILLIPLVMTALMKINPEKSEAFNLCMGLVAAFIFIIAGISDIIDGYYARKYKINSVFGKYFDPLADKMLILASMIMLIPLNRIPAWIVVIFLAREIAITALRGIASSEQLTLPADYWGKRKTLLQTIALVGLMVHHRILGVDLAGVGWVVLILALVLAVASGMNYVWKFIKAIQTQVS